MCSNDLKAAMQRATQEALWRMMDKGEIEMEDVTTTLIHQANDLYEPQKKLKLWIVGEEDPTDLGILLGLAEDYRLTPSIFSNPADALTSTGSPDFVIYDIGGGETAAGRGCDILRRIIERHPGAIFIVTSAILEWARATVQEIAADLGDAVVEIMRQHQISSFLEQQGLER